MIYKVSYTTIIIQSHSVCIVATNPILVPAILAKQISSLQANSPDSTINFTIESVNVDDEVYN